MKTKLKNKMQGFTIIEVMIVLAIAGLIMLIVFLAVPALQRNSRNTQRQNDASRIVAAINECQSNKNGSLASCSSKANLEDGYIKFEQNQQIFDFQPSANAPAGVTQPDGKAYFHTGQQCSATGDSTQTGGGPRAFTVTYHAETSGGITVRCIAG